ncbi:hypothetical protein M9978_16470 [Sphingomonas sp. MG17]|uniref:Uncharacterized protein n=1 Tax=Sphingomonas tagetis TaxID=2949092 RepID=A0A9X2HP75_9SPHN|nr:hypothetical protein [Sphingomonas tagetis]MCP3732021.1 hypothetical protein [Sphingomonas tagetis]
MYHDGTILPPGVRLGEFARMIDAFERDQIELAVELLIARLDAEDGDCDLEDDDPAGGNVEDQGEPGSWPELGPDGRSFGMSPIGDDDREPEDVSLRARHRRHIQMERCYPQYRYGRVEYRLLDGEHLPAGVQPW